MTCGSNTLVRTTILQVSLLHFVVFFLLGGVTVIVVGAVQFKEEAGWSELR